MSCPRIAFEVWLEEDFFEAAFAQNGDSFT